MEKLRVVCPACQARLLVPAEEAGRSGKCPDCGGVVQVPALAAPAPAGDAPAPVEEPAPPAAPARNGAGLAAAAGAALVGALGWALILKTASSEIGWIAWGIGGMVGWAAVKAGGRGQALALGAAALTVLSIFGGKLLGYHLQIRADIQEMAAQDEQSFDEYRRDAADWAELRDGGEPAPEAVRAFMSSHGYTELGAREIEAEELDSFLIHMAPRLDWLHGEQPTREEFAERSAADLRGLVFAESSLAGLVLDDLNGIDALFAFLGISTAFGLVKRKEERTEAA